MKKFFFNFIIFIFTFIVLDLLFSNFINKDTFRYACYNYEIDFYLLIPNCTALEKFEATGSKFKVKTNNRGYRYNGIKKNHISKEEILILGDSQAYGVGLNYEDTFVGKIENNYNEYEVSNLAVPSYSPSIYHYQLKNLIREGRKPKKIFLILDIIDLSQESFRWKNQKQGDKPYLLQEIHKKKEDEATGWKKFRRDNFKGYRIISYNLREYLRLLRKKNDTNQIYSPNIKKTHWGEFTYVDKKDLQTEIWKNLNFDQALIKLTNNLKSISNLSKSINSEFYIVIFPWAETLEYGQNSFNFENFIIKTCSEIYCNKTINLFPIFRNIKNEYSNWRKEFFLIDDIHFNAKGQNVIYKEITKSL